MTTDDLSCRELVELVTDYLENRLTSAERLRFEVHLSNCPDCTLYISQMQFTIKALSLLPSPELPSEIESALLKAFRNWKATTAL